MRGSIIKRYEGSYSLVLDLGRDANGKRKQKWITFRGTRKQAETKLTELVRSHDTGTFVEPSKRTLGDWLTEWLTTLATTTRPSTVVCYRGVVMNHLLPAPMAALPLQQVRPTHVEAFCAAQEAKGLAAATVTKHHAVLRRALRKAVKARLLVSNPAWDLDRTPGRGRDVSADARRHCWSLAEARAFLAEAKRAGPQPAAFYTLALDTGLRKGEICGLRWANVDLERGLVRVVEQLTSSTVRDDGTLALGPTKTGRPRTVTLGAETVALLRAHKSAQAALKMAHRTTYHDFGLVFAKEWNELTRQTDWLGNPLQMQNFGAREYARLIRAAGVKRIKFHGLRHTCATLLLQAGQPVHVVADRLGHAKITTTLQVYAHVLPDMGQQAAATLGALLHG